MPEQDGMEPFEERLRKALGRKEPPPDFAAKVLRAVEAQAARPQPAVHGSWLPRWMPAAIAAMLVLFVGVAYQRHEREKAGRRAKEELVFALQITGDRLHRAQAKVASISEMEGSN